MNPNIKPKMYLRETDIKPRISNARDFKTQMINRLLGRGMLIGVLGLTYPQDITVKAGI